METISSPTLLLSEEVCRANIRRMAKKAQNNGVAFKPHMKTHQSAKVGRWIREAGAQTITVSSVQMARYFADAGWQDITIAFPVNPRDTDAIDHLAAQIDLTLLVNSVEVAKRLDNNLNNTLATYIEIDSGAGRTGLRPNQKEEISKLITTIKNTNRLRWIGFYSHPGHSYQARSEQQILNIHQSIESQCEGLQSEFSSLAESFFEICVGDTPCCSVATTFSGIDAISPGNFVFYDLMQHHIGSCNVKDIAVAMTCPIVDRYPDRNELILHGGAVHFSKDKITQRKNEHYGLAAEITNNHWQIVHPKMYLHALSQEHGVVRCDGKVIERYNVGDVIYILPIHSCLTANLMKRYRTINSQRTIPMMAP